MLESYLTVCREAKAETIEKKSRFITHVKPVASEEDAQTFLAVLRKLYWDASHHVYAYQIGLQNPVQRQSDDGEPSGTAGLPVLDAIRAARLTNVMVVVVRYFGGTLLGTGGLVRVYGHAAKEGLRLAGVVEMTLGQRFYVTVPYPLAGRLQFQLEQAHYRIETVEYTDAVRFCVIARVCLCQALEALVMNATDGQAGIERAGEPAYTDSC